MAAGRLLTGSFVALTLSDLAYFTATGILIAATPLFVTGPVGSDAGAVGLVMGSFSVTTLLLRPVAGRWADRHGRRLLLVGGSGAFAVIALGHFLVDDVAGLVVVRLLLGAAEAFYFVAGFAALADLAPPGRAGEALSLNSLALYLGIGLGPLLGQGLLEWHGYDAAWAGAVGLAAAAALLATTVPETRPAQDDAPPGAWVHRAAVVPGVALLCGVLLMSGFLSFAALQARAVGIERWSAVLLVFGAVVVVCRLVFAKLPDRVPPPVMIGGSLALGAAAFLVVGGVREPGGVVAGAVLLGLGMAFLTPAVFATVLNAVPAAERGSAGATTSMFLDLGLSGGPMLLGGVAAATTIAGGFLWVAVVPLAGAALVTPGLVRRRRLPSPDCA